jgi:hypothetical protein
VVLPQAEETEPGLVRQLGQLDDFLKSLLRGQCRAGVDVSGELTKGEDAKVHVLLNIQVLGFIPASAQAGG